MSIIVRHQLIAVFLLRRDTNSRWHRSFIFCFALKDAESIIMRDKYVRRPEIRATREYTKAVLNLSDVD